MMGWADDYTVIGQLNINDWIRAQSINKESFEDILKCLEEKAEVCFARCCNDEKNMLVGITQVGDTNLEVRIDGINKIRVSYSRKDKARSTLTSNVKDAGAVLKSFKTIAEARKDR